MLCAKVCSFFFFFFFFGIYLLQLNQLEQGIGEDILTQLEVYGNMAQAPTAKVGRKAARKTVAFAPINEKVLPDFVNVLSFLDLFISDFFA